MEGFLGGSVVKNPPANEGDVGSVPGSGRSPGEGNGNPHPLHWQVDSLPLSHQGNPPFVHTI